MLVKLIYEVEQEWKKKGVSLSHKHMHFEDDNISGEFYEAHYNPNHPFWADKFDRNVERNTRVGSIVQTATPGIIAGYHADMFINCYTDYNVSEKTKYGGYIHRGNGLMYDRDDFVYIMENAREMHLNPEGDYILPSGREVPKGGMEAFSDTYGCADNIGQVLKKFKKLLSSTDQFVICYHPVHKKNNGGWRWHKNGEYIGCLRDKCKHEYLSQESKIESIIQYHIYLVHKKETV